ncbi:MAG: sugar ABC transporter permease [Chloroflexi bacterium]|nr:sugar ABC transporter permease [Chloroflexota bacterium]
MSLFIWDYLTPVKPFVGLDNYANLLGSAEFWTSLRTTVFFAAGVVPLGLLSGISLALLVDRRVRGIGLYRAAFFSPVVTSGVAVSLIWRWLLDTEFGLVNYALNAIGIPSVPWLNDPATAPLAIIFLTAWHAAGSNMVIFLAGLQSIPQEYYEAARVDGAGRLRLFFSITLPLLRPTTIFVLLMSTIGALQVFDSIYVMTKGGPMGATQTVVYMLYRHAFEWYEMGFASAIAYVLFAVIFVLTLIQWRFTGRNLEIY